MSKKEPKCKLCWDKGYSTQLVNIYTGADFIGDKSTSELKELKHYCSCRKGKKMEREAKNICPSCQFEEGEHSQSCPKYKEVELEVPKQKTIKAWAVIRNKRKWEKLRSEIVNGRLVFFKDIKGDHSDIFYLSDIISQTRAEAIKETLKGIKEGKICLNCGGKKEGELSDWCDDCLDEN